jgi:hypothetical protein
MADGEKCDGLVTANTEPNSEQLTGRRRSLANLKPWPKGFCPNPKGRGPKPITEAYAKLARKKVPGDPKGRTYADLVAEGQYASARKGKTDAAREIADRLEGKAFVGHVRRVPYLSQATVCTRQQFQWQQRPPHWFSSGR